MPSLHPEIQHQLTVLETLIAHAPVGVAYVDREMRFVHANAMLAEIHGRTPSDLIGRRVVEITPHLWPRIADMYARVMQGEVILDEEVEAGESSDGTPRVFLASHYPIRVDGAIAGVGVLVKDVTDARDTERALRVRSDLYAMLSRTNRAVSRCHSSEELYHEVCEIAVDIGGYLHAFVTVPDYPNVRLVASAGNGGELPTSEVTSLDESDPRSKGPTSTALLKGEVVVVHDFQALLATTPWADLAARLGIGSALTLPIRRNGDVVAAFTLYSPKQGFFTPEMLVGLAEIPPTIAFALERYEQERVRLEDEAELRQRDRAIRAASQGIVIADATAPSTWASLSEMCCWFRCSSPVSGTGSQNSPQPGISAYSTSSRWPEGCARSSASSSWIYGPMAGTEPVTGFPCCGAFIASTTPMPPWTSPPRTGFTPGKSYSRDFCGCS